MNENFFHVCAIQKKSTKFRVIVDITMEQPKYIICFLKKKTTSFTPVLPQGISTYITVTESRIRPTFSLLQLSKHVCNSSSSVCKSPWFMKIETIASMCRNVTWCTLGLQFLLWDVHVDSPPPPRDSPGESACFPFHTPKAILIPVAIKFPIICLPLTMACEIETRQIHFLQSVFVWFTEVKQHD